MGIALLMASATVSMAFPAECEAYTMDDHQANEGTTSIGLHDTMNTNRGTISVNDGTLEHNSERAIVYTNNGEITYNENGATVETNTTSGTIGTNSGTVVNNLGTINNGDNYGTGSITYNRGEASNITGIVENNYGTLRDFKGNLTDNYGQVTASSAQLNYITNNHEGGEISGSRATINNNYATVCASTTSGQDNNITINNHYGGSLSVQDGGNPGSAHLYIVNNYTETAYDSGAITDTNRFLSVTVEGVNNADVTYNRSGFVHNDTTNKEYIQVKRDSQPAAVSGSITLRPEDGYQITNNGGSTGTTQKLSYALNRNSDGSYTVTITSISGYETLTPDTLHLIISAIEHQSADQGQSIVISNAMVIEDPADDRPSDNNASTGTPDYAQETLKGIQTQVNAQTSLARQTGSQLTAVDISFKSRNNMDSGLFRYLCESFPFGKRCHFTYKGQHYVLYIPAFDISDPAYREGLEMLNKEPSGTAGFLRLEQLFKPLGFVSTIID